MYIWIRNDWGRNKMNSITPNYETNLVADPRAFVLHITEWGYQQTVLSRTHDSVASNTKIWADLQPS